MKTLTSTTIEKLLVIPCVLLTSVYYCSNYAIMTEFGDQLIVTVEKDDIADVRVSVLYLYCKDSLLLRDV